MNFIHTRFLLCIGIALLPAPRAQGSYFYAAASAGGGATYLRDQNFEGTGYDNSETWSETAGTPDEDYTATVLLGSQSLFLDGSGSANQRTSCPTFTGQTDVWYYFLWRPVTLTGSGTTTFCSVMNGTTELFQVQCSSAGALRVSGSVNSAATTSTVTVGNTYHVWVHYAADIDGGAASALCSVAFSTTGTKPTSGNNYTAATTGTDTATSNNMRFLVIGTTLTQNIYDHFLADDVSIGDNP